MRTIEPCRVRETHRSERGTAHVWGSGALARTLPDSDGDSLETVGCAAFVLPPLEPLVLIGAEILACDGAQGLCDVGINVIDLGIATTPSVGIMLRELGCAGGVVITASHNPGQYNGIKLLLDNGVAPPIDAVKQIAATGAGKT